MSRWGGVAHGYLEPLTLSDLPEPRSPDVRYVMPERPADTEGLSEQELAALVTRDGMIGVARL